MITVLIAILAAADLNVIARLACAADLDAVDYCFGRGDGATARVHMHVSALLAGNYADSGLHLEVDEEDGVVDYHLTNKESIIGSFASIEQVLRVVAEQYPSDFCQIDEIAKPMADLLG